MSYTSKDLDTHGRPAPRGEICCRGNGISSGYYKNEEKTAETFDKDGWLYSGDIGIIVPNSSALKIIDRKKGIFKLSQGEYIAPDRLQNIYKRALGVADIFIPVSSLKHYIVGIVVVCEENFPILCKQKGLVKASCSELILCEEAKGIMLGELDRIAKLNSLAGFEKIKKVSFCKETFGELDLITTTFKVKRKEAAAHFKGMVHRLLHD
jgi:long-chain acyl-CoA synthetase